MDKKELKRIHGKDVELAPDDSEDEKLTEKQALALAKKQGIEFVDTFVVVDVETLQPKKEGFKTYVQAEKACDKLGDRFIVAQRRERKNG